ncbi:hypothetical protein [Nocardiopsis metallicus]|uniref:Uncharacterized protein n=1 Tax=Nocardiopsis metallicus TaxID=179819 RepID=A0A840WSZ9_9ACTN|nr:hypothetical protein [Nocardiopsis metallicus]MBB5494736.1 hypothetical protein [Nocardiopsis metallicus]
MTEENSWKITAAGVLEARAVITQVEDGWLGRLDGKGTQPGIAADKVSEVRTYLATKVWENAQAVDLGVALSEITKVRLYSRVVSRYERDGEHLGGDFTVTAAADRGQKGWVLTTLGGSICATPQQREAELLMGMLGATATPPCHVTGNSFGEARESLAQAILMELAFQGDEVIEDWSALNLTVITRKSFSVSSLGI